MIRIQLNQSILISSLLFAAGPAHAQGTVPESSPTPSDIATKPQSPDQNPIQQLSDAQITAVLLTANHAEVSQGKLAQKTAKNKEVVQFAKQMIQDHNASMKEVKTLNARLKVKEQGSVVRDQLETAARSSDGRLKGQKGTEFDKSYIDEQVAMHQTVLDTIDIQLLPNAKAEELKTLLTKTRTTVAAHLDHAKQLQNTKPTM